jgi:hypothetical protein
MRVLPQAAKSLTRLMFGRGAECSAMFAPDMAMDSEVHREYPPAVLMSSSRPAGCEGLQRDSYICELDRLQIHLGRIRDTNHKLTIRCPGELRTGICFTLHIADYVRTISWLVRPRQAYC